MRVIASLSKNSGADELFGCMVRSFLSFPSVMSLDSPVTPAEPPDFWETFGQVPLDGYKSSARTSMVNGNATLTATWEKKAENPAPWYHAAYRLLYRRLLASDYAMQAGIGGFAAVQHLEDPEVDFTQMKQHGSVHKAAAFWTADINSRRKGNKERLLLEAGLDRYLAGVTAKIRLEVNRLMIRERILAGAEAFHEKTGLNMSTLRARVDQDRITSFDELLAHLSALGSIKKRRIPTLWTEAGVVQAREAFTADVIAQGARPEQAVFRAMVEFAGIPYTTEGLHRRLGLKRSVAECLVNNRPVALAELEKAMGRLAVKVGAEPIASLRASWPQETVNAPTSPRFAVAVRDRMKGQGVTPEHLTDAFQVQLGDGQVPSDVVRNALERGPARVMPPAVLVHLTATGVEDAGEQTRATNAELVERWTPHLREGSSPPLRAALQLYGVTLEEADSGDQLENLRSLMNGSESTLPEAEALDIIRRAGLNLRVLPVLRRWVEAREPRSMADVLRLLAEVTPRNIAGLAAIGDTSADTLYGVTRGETAVPYAVFARVLNASDVHVPAASAIDCHLRYAETLKQYKALGAAIYAIIARTHRYPRAFRRDRNAAIPPRTFRHRLETARDTGEMPEADLQLFLTAAGISLTSPCAAFLTMLRTGASIDDVLPAWYAHMQQEKRDDLLQDLEELMLFFEKRNTQPEQRRYAGVGTAEDETSRLLKRKVLLDDWRRGKLEEDTVSRGGDVMALAGLMELPGLTEAHFGRLKPLVQAHTQSSRVATRPPVSNGGGVSASRPPVMRPRLADVPSEGRSLPSESTVTNWIRTDHISFFTLFNNYRGPVMLAVRDAWVRNRNASDDDLCAAAIAKLRQLESRAIDREASDEADDQEQAG